MRKKKYSRLQVDRKTGDPTPMTIYYFVHLTGRDRGNTGIQRVSRNLARSLQSLDQFEIFPIRWCAEKKCFIHAEDEFCEAMALYDGPRFSPNQHAGKPIEIDRSNGSSACMLIPEVPHLGSHDIRYPPVQMSEVVGHARARDLPIAAVFYDLLPLTHSDVDRPPPFELASFNAYGLAISYADLLLPISIETERELRQWWIPNGVGNQHRAKITTVKLPEEMKQAPRHAALNGTLASGSIEFVSFGTVCRRKNQVTTMRAFNSLRERRPDLDIRLNIVGSVAPEVAAQASVEASYSEGRISLLGPRSDKDLIDIVQRARASVFVSLAEGFGLPIVESLWLGTPCICSNEGAAAEAASGGGCLMINPSSKSDIELALLRLSTDVNLVRKLQDDISERSFRSWNDYARGVADALRVSFLE